MRLSEDPHGGSTIAESGIAVAGARLAVVMIHGRGASATEMLALAAHLAVPDAAFLAPQAALSSWWPHSFLAPLSANQPWIESALRAVDRAVAQLTGRGLGRERICLLGFSQGACLALEYAARSGAGMAAVIGLSGGLIGTADLEEPPRQDLYGHASKRFDYAGALAGSAVFLGCHERDPHIPLARVRQTASVFGALGASVDMRIMPGAGHGIVDSEIRAVREMLAAVPPRP